MTTYITTDPSSRPLYGIMRAVWYLLDILEAMLLLRFILKLLGANPNAEFTQIVYSLTHPLVVPFQAVFPPVYVSGTAFEWTTLLAMLVYWLVAVAIVRLLAIGSPVRSVEEV